MSSQLATLSDFAGGFPPKIDDSLGWMNLLYQATLANPGSTQVAEFFHSKALAAVALRPVGELVRVFEYATMRLPSALQESLLQACVDNGAFTFATLLENANKRDALHKKLLFDERSYEGITKENLEHNIRHIVLSIEDDWCTSKHPLWKALERIPDEERHEVLEKAILPSFKMKWPFYHEKVQGSDESLQRAIKLLARAWNVYPAQVVVAMLLEHVPEHVDVRNNVPRYWQNCAADVQEILEYSGHPRAAKWAKYIEPGNDQGELGLPDLFRIAANGVLHRKSSIGSPIEALELPSLT